MTSEIHSSETQSATDAGGYDQTVGDALLSSSGSHVNMTNCCKHCQQFLDRCKDGVIHGDVLISYWMMAGYLSPIESVDEAFRKGHDLLWDLIRRGVLKPSDQDSEMIELVGSQPIQSCRHGLSPCDARSVGLVEMLEVDRIEQVLLTDGMMKKRNRSPAGDYLCRQVFQSRRGLKYIAHFNPTPNSLNPLVETFENPLLLMLRGCDDSIFSTIDFTPEKFKTLTTLEISGSGILTFVPMHPTVSKMTQLRYLHLSDPLIDRLPEGLFSELLQLRWLILRGCSRLVLDGDLGEMRNLEVLDLSCTSTTKKPDMGTQNLTHILVRDSALISFKIEIAHSPRIKVLDLSGNPNLRELEINAYVRPRSFQVRVLALVDLVVLDLSRTQIQFAYFLGCMVNLRNVILRECTGLIGLPRIDTLTNLEVLNLAGSSRLEDLEEGFFDQLSCLVELDLSATKLKRLPSLANLTSLHKLALRDLELDSLEVETWTSLSNLVELDLHGLKINTSEPEETKFDFLSSLSLRRLVLTNRPPLSSVGNLEFPDLCGTNDQIDFIGVTLSNKSEDLQGQTTIAKAAEFHIVYDVGHTAFDRFIYGFKRIDTLISEIQRSSTRQTISTNKNEANYFERQFEMLHADMKYIHENIDRLKGSRNCKSSEELLHELVDAATRLSAADFKDDSPNLKQLLRLIVKLKLLLAPPIKTANGQEASKTIQKKKQPLLIKSAQIVAEPNEEPSVAEHHPQGITGLRLKYQHLTRNQKNCLLCFSAFPCNEEEEEKNTGVVLKKSLVINKRILIYWWVGEGFIKNDSREEKSYEDDGKKILEVLGEKGFIENVIRGKRKSQSFRMHHYVHSFVTAEAKSEGFFDFNQGKNNYLDPFVTRSKKDSLPQTEANIPGYTITKLWANRVNYQREMEILRNVLTLFNVNGSVIDIKPEWFSKMKQLSVLSLGSLGCSENIKQSEIVDQMFFEELKSMKQLGLISLQGIMTIMKLPDSICTLSSLKILDLRECGYLEELPTGIGSLRNLIYLDLTDCVVLNKMPKGINLLSNLEVLMGFRVTREQAVAGDQNASSHKATKSRWWEKTMNKGTCTLRDLSKLQRLRKLSLVVNIKEFPNRGDVEVLMGMKRLRKLKILWERSFDFVDPNMDHEETSKTGEDHVPEQHVDDIGHFGGLEKLELWCIPYKTPPDWLDSRKFENLQKLCIVGGDLIEFSGIRLNPWPNLKTLRLKYLLKTRMGGDFFRMLFPNLTYMEIKECIVCSDSIWWNDKKIIWDQPWESYPGRFLM